MSDVPPYDGMDTRYKPGEGRIDPERPPAGRPFSFRLPSVRYLDGSREALRALVEVLRLLIGSTVEIGLPAAFEPLRLHIERIAREAEVAKLDGAGMLWNGLAYHLHDVADYAAALAIDEAVFGPDDPHVARDLNNLGNMLHSQGDLTGARAALERALEIDEETLGLDHPTVAHRLNNLGRVLRDRGNFARSHATYERALVISEEIWGRRHAETARTLWGLGALAQERGAPEQARDYLRETLSILEECLPPEHPHVQAVRDALEELEASG